MAAYSIDFRQKTLRACERPLGSQRTIAHIVGVSRASVANVWRQDRATGAMAPKARAGGQRLRLEAAAPAVVQRLVGGHPAAPLEGVGTSVAAETGVRVSAPAMCRVLQRLR